MSVADKENIALKNIRSFTLFRMFFSARFYYPVYALMFFHYGVELDKFALLNALWAASIVLLEIPSGALADTVGRRNLLIFGAVCMVIEMGVLLVAPIGGGAWLFTLFAINRVLSGAAEAAVSGADEALVYDSMKAAGIESRWGHVMERVQRDTSLAFFFAMMVGAACYDPAMVNAVLKIFGSAQFVVQEQLVKVPIFLTFLSGIVVLLMALRMKEARYEHELTTRETLSKSWSRTQAAAKWIWLTPLPFGIILAAMVIDSTVRQFLTLASEYWNVIQLPIASYGLIGSGMALMGVFVPRLARYLSEGGTPLRSFLITVTAVFVGLYGLAMAIPFWGILPAVFLYASIQLTGYFVSIYLNKAAPSEQRATVLSFRGLATNFAYGAVSILYSGLILALQAKHEADLDLKPEHFQPVVFVDSLSWFPLCFLVSVAAIFMIHRVRFRKGD
ncbi:MAG: MFS transporter [Lentimonas sp.]